jgi:uncharacterized repeat protein (TIGR03803 family)
MKRSFHPASGAIQQERRLLMKTLIRTLLFAISVMATTNGWTASAYKVLHYFGDGNDGWEPEAALIFDAKGNLYGTTTVGGLGCLSPGCGIVFQLQPNSDGTWTENVLHNLRSTEGAMSHAPVVFDGQGNLYGTAPNGGSSNQGSVFKLLRSSSGSWPAIVLQSFTGGSDGGNPYGGVLLDSAGKLYGMTSAGGASSAGVVFSLSGQNIGAETVLRSFAGGSDGSGPMSALISDAAGNLYGTTYTGGANGAGTVFKLSPNRSSPGWAYSLLHSFTAVPYGNGGDGANPYAGLAFDAAGNLYGTTVFGGPAGGGVVYKLSPNANGSWTESVIYAFQGGNDGNTPYGGVVFDAAGNLYGTTSSGGSGGRGTVYKLTPTSGGGWTETILHNFTGHADGGLPGAGVLLDAAGNIYGTAAMGGHGGLENGGVVFEISPN